MKRTTTVLSLTAVVAVGAGIPLASMGANAANTGAKPVVAPVAADSIPGLASDEHVTAKDTRTLPDGSKATRYERTYKGLEVNGGRFAVIQEPGESLAEAQVIKPAITVPSTDPKLSGAEAVRRVPLATTLAGAKLTKQTQKLVIFMDAQGGSHLAYDVYTEGSGYNVLDVKKHTFVDANTGAILGYDSDIKGGRGDGVFNKDVTFGTKRGARGYTFGDDHGNTTNDLAGGQSGPGTPMNDADDVWGGSNYIQAQGVDAQKGVELTYDFFNDTYGRRGIWDNGKGAVARIRWKNCFANAQWDGRYISLGEGANCQNPLTQLDVMAHEMAHGVTGSTSGFRYERESGGLNEAMSDIFGTLAEWYANIDGDTPDYLLGELIDINGNGKPLRYMDKPSKDGKSLDCWTPQIASGAINVHNTSGPMNHAFYLMSEGSGAKTINGVAYNSPTCDGGTVQGIGRDKAGKIVYTALTSPTVSVTETYKQWRDELIKAAKSLYGPSSQECRTVAAAMSGISVAQGTQACASGPVGTSTATPTTSTPTITTSTPTITSTSTTSATSSTDTTSTTSTSSATTSTSTSTSATSTTTPSTTGTPSTTSTSTGDVPTPAGVTMLTNGESKVVSGNPEKGDTYFAAKVPAGATNLVMEISGGTGDVDLSTRFGDKPTDDQFDCRPYQTGNDESCIVGAPQAGLYYVRLKPYVGYSDVSVKISWTGGSNNAPGPAPKPDGAVLANDTPIRVSGADESKQYYSFTLPQGVRKLTVSTTGGTGDVDLYMKHGGRPNLVSYQCRPDREGNEESCSVSYPASGTYYVMLHGYGKYDGVSLKASWS